ncbi:MAG TPA: XRE family transcriptional regulator [Streptosporangiaceae bacterium]|nr:XRE family transcriptional regulator [Streptosporangiaceae bacterium]
MKRPSPQMAGRLDDILGADGAFSRFVAEPVRVPIPSLELLAIAPDADLYDRITKTVNEPARVDGAVVEWLERTLDEHRRVEDAVGARPLLGLIRAQLVTVTEFTRSAPGPLTDRLVSLASQYAQFVAWMCIATHDHAAALAWYDRAHDWAQQAGDANMAATALSMKAHLAWSAGDPRRCIQMAKAARWPGSRVTPGVQGMAAQMGARGHALAGEAKSARSLLDEAQELVRRAAERPEDEPPWMYFYGEDWFRLQRGMAEAHLGNWSAAADLLTRGLTALPESYRRDRAWYGACLANAHAMAGDAECAESVALHFAGDIAALNDYARAELLKAARSLDRRAARQGRTIKEALAVRVQES